MRKSPEFVSSFVEAAKRLLEEGCVSMPLFSRGTYQFEVKEKKEKFFPFLQLTDAGELTDSFCTCPLSEKGEGCPHLAAAYLTIFRDHPEPLHVRFQHSFWNHLLQMVGGRLGWDVKVLKKGKKGEYAAFSKTKKKLFLIEPKNKKAQLKLQKMVEERVVETEETSIKFSNRSSEEIAEYKGGRGSFELLYELSVWSDLAKWLMLLTEEKGDYEVVFDQKEGHLPDGVLLHFPSLTIWCYLPEAHWAELIPSLTTVQSPLAVFDEGEGGLERIDYDPIEQTLSLVPRELHFSDNTSGGIEVGAWRWVEGKGFYRRNEAALFEKKLIAREELGEALSQFGKEWSRYLPIHPETIPARYRLHFDADYRLLIEFYLFEPGDLTQEGSGLFPPFVYLPSKGFFRVSDLLFPMVIQEIPRSEVSEFIGRHRLWLRQFPGFETHLGHLEAHLTYSLSPEKQLSFHAELNFPNQFEETVDFDEWVYIHGSGFYMKQQNRGRLPLHPGLVLSEGEIGPFIASHREELEQVQHFFSSEPIVVRLGLSIQINPEGAIELIPTKEYGAQVDPTKVHLFGDFAYLEGRGFSPLPPGSAIPERYRHPVVLSLAQEAPFLAYELEALKPYLLSLDPRLQKPERLRLKIRKLEKERRRSKADWLVDLTYESEHGSVDLFTLWDAFAARKKHLFSTAGYLSLKEARFYWIKQLKKRQLDRKRGWLRLTTLEWIRLTIFEQIEPPQGNDPEAAAMRQLFDELSRFESGRLLDISRLQSQLRPYQETGLQWLWFLYCHGLSGLLCDDMGLGKTHQAMALLAAILQEDREREHKYLVVCPTSVIYHWQDLLRRFLPDLRVCTYYGLERSLDRFATDFDLLLTSYGILRLGKEELRSFSFETVIFDEIQVAKNASSQTHQVLCSIDARMRLGLTGTPIENRLHELKSLFDVILPNYMPPDPIFRELFVQPIEKLGEERAKTLLHQLIKPFILRRKKSEVLFDLPEKIEEIAYCDLSEEQQQLYRETALSLRATFYADLQDPSKPVPYIHVFAALSKLKQICNHPCLLTEEIKKYQKHASGKWDLFVELLQEAQGSGQKVVVFSQYLNMLAIIEEHLKKKGIGFATIKGSTKDRNEQLRRFREDPSCQVFTASLLAAGVGIDLTVASVVIHYDRWWNPAKENQATDRVHRIGQNRGVQVFKLVTKHTIEERIHELIEKKKGLLEEIVGYDEADQIRYLDREELLSIFETLFEGQ